MGVDQRVVSESGDQGGVLECLQVDIAGGGVPLQLDDDEVAAGVDSEDVDPVLARIADRVLPAVVFTRDDHDVVADHVGMFNQPLFEMLSLEKAGCSHVRRSQRFGGGSGDREHVLVLHHLPPNTLLESGSDSSILTHRSHHPEPRGRISLATATGCGVTR